MAWTSATFVPGGAYRPYRLVGGALALLVLLVTLGEWASVAANPVDRDFLGFWGAARLAIAGRAAAAYDGGALHAVQAAAATFGSDGGLPFPYPPAFLIPALPFGFLPYPAGLSAWVLTSFAAYMVAVGRMFPGIGWLAAAFPPVLVNAAIGQNGLLTAAVFVAGLYILPRRPLTAGLLLGCLVVKPQLGLMLPIALVAGGQWRAIVGAAVSSVGAMLLGLFLFGTEVTLAWLDQVQVYAAVTRDGLVGWHKLASVYASARQAGLGAEIALALHAMVAVAAAWAVWRVWRSDVEPTAKAAVLAAATVLVSPYLFLYDAALLVLPFAWLAARGTAPAFIAALWCLPLVTIAQTYAPIGPVNLNPVVPVALLILAYRRARIAEARVGPDSPQPFGVARGVARG